MTDVIYLMYVDTDQYFYALESLSPVQRYLGYSRHTLKHLFLDVNVQR